MARFIVKDGWPPESADPGTFILVSDNWDDFNYKTTFNLHFADEAGQVTEIGLIKIASRGMKEGDPRINLPSEFSQLPENVFSLGQSREYYEKLVALSYVDATEVFAALNDVAANTDIMDLFKNEDVFRVSLLRDVPFYTVSSQFKRITERKAPLTKYDFYYHRQSDSNVTPDLELKFSVNPDSLPPTNVHVVIGANGVGKSMMLRDMVNASMGSERAIGTLHNETLFSSNDTEATPFVNVVHVTFSAFDSTSAQGTYSDNIRMYTVGLPSQEQGTLDSQFSESFWTCTKEPRRARLVEAYRTLEYADPLLADSGLSSLLEAVYDIDLPALIDRFKAMSSGHKIAILTVTRLVELVEEQSLVLIDEPETHLHPPLLSALTRTISDLVIDRNGVAIIATHSPVVLQEVPRSCVWRLRRSGQDLRASRLDVESFGESVSKLTSEVFHLDVTKTGYHEILRRLINDNGTVDAALGALDGQLGGEGYFVLNSIAHNKSNDDV